MGILPAFASSLLNLVEAAKKKAKAENKPLGFIMCYVPSLFFSPAPLLRSVNSED
jgi:hypothetical protein